MRLKDYLKIICLPLALTVIAVVPCLAQSQSASPNDKLIEAQVSNQEAQAAYYRKQLQERPFWQKIGDNPAAIGAVIAAFVALVSFIFNYRATLRNQIDTQFYEAMKRFGDKESPTLRSSAAGILSQMGRSRALTARWRRPFFWRYPYFRTAFDQLITGHLVEEDQVALNAISSSLFELISAHHKLARAKLFSMNNSLSRDLVRSLADFFIAKSAAGVQVNVETSWKIEDIHDDLWSHAAFVTLYEKKALQNLAGMYKDAFSNDLNAAILSKELMTDEQKSNNSIIAHKSLQKTANRLQVNGNMCGSSFRSKSLLLSILFLIPQLRFMSFKRFRRRRLRGRAWLAQPFLTNATLPFINLQSIWMWRPQLSRASLTGARLYNVKLDDAELERTMFMDSSMLDVDLSHANLKWAYFLSAKLYKVKFSNANLQGANFNMARLSKTDFSNADLQEARFSSAYLSNINLSRATNLPAVDFGHAKLNRVNLSKVDLRGANLRFAELRNVNLARANLEGALLYGAKIDDTTSLENVEWWKADFSYGENISGIDNTVLENLYRRFGDAIPKDINIDTDAHASAREFLKSKIKTEQGKTG